MAVKMKVNWNQFEKVLKGYSKMIEFTSLDLAGQLGFESPVDTGRLSTSFGAVMLSPYRGQAGTNTVYSLPIVGMTVRSLSKAGTPVLGQMGNPYADRAIVNTGKKLADIARAAADAAGISANMIASPGMN